MEDLISYSFQVARGMEYMASRKVRASSFSDRLKQTSGYRLTVNLNLEELDANILLSS